jgi:alcohol dehydrogenase (cytochrome c)
MRRIQYVVGLAALALAAASVGYAQGPQGRGDAQGGRAGAPPAAPAAPARPTPAVLQNYAAVTEARLKNPEDNNWLLLRRTYNGWGYSPLKQITTGNVNRLKYVWSYSTGEVRGHEAPPLVNNGVMFVSTPNNQVLALDAKTGDLFWRFSQPVTTGRVPHPTSRGVALFEDKVFFALGESFLVALDAKTGREVWRTEVADNKSAYYITLAPLVAGGGVMVGASGGEYGVRGFVASFDLNTGKERWRTYTIPAPGEPGSESWPAGGNQWKTGGGSVWVTANYDQDANTAYWGTGNGGPWMGDQRPGDNLYTSSTIALDATTGKMKGYFQYTPNESFDWDEVSPPVLIDFRRNGRTIKGLIDFARNGYMYFLDRTDGSTINFVDGKPFVLQDAFKGLDPKTGRPIMDPDHKPGTNKDAHFCPSFSGGKNWPPIAYSPDTRMVYVPANNGLCSSMMGTGPMTYQAGSNYTGVRMTGSGPDPRGTNPNIGEVQAWNVDTAEKVWTTSPVASVNWGGMLATGGGLVFNGGTADRKIRAYDAKTGKELWAFPLNTAAIAPPTTFVVDGKQYIALNAGWGGDADGIQRGYARGNPAAPQPPPQGGTVWVFAIE